MSMVIETEENQLESSHDRQGRGVDEDLSPMEEYLWIEQSRALQVTIHQIVIPHSPSHLTQSAQVQDIVQEDLGLHVGVDGTMN